MFGATRSSAQDILQALHSGITAGVGAWGTMWSFEDQTELNHMLEPLYDLSSPEKNFNWTFISKLRQSHQWEVYKGCGGGQNSDRTVFQHD